MYVNFQILIGPRDWEDYLSSKEGAERYRTHNLPNCSSCPGLYELGIAISLPQTESKSITTKLLKVGEMLIKKQRMKYGTMLP